MSKHQKSAKDRLLELAFLDTLHIGNFIIIKGFKFFLLSNPLNEEERKVAAINEWRVTYSAYLYWQEFKDVEVVARLVEYLESKPRVPFSTNVTYEVFVKDEQEEYNQALQALENCLATFDNKLQTMFQDMTATTSAPTYSNLVVTTIERRFSKVSINESSELGFAQAE